jgi:GTP-binding protein LepA
MIEQKNIRNFAILAHIDHGKSTLSDRLLELTGTIEMRKMKEQLLDTMDLERERGITIKMQPVRMKYHKKNRHPEDGIKPDEGSTENYNQKYQGADSSTAFDQRSHFAQNDGQDYILNLIDTPGHVDFGYEVSRSLAAVEGAVLLVDATKGVQAQTLANLYQAIDNNLDIIPVVNKIDLPNADIEKAKREIMHVLGCKSEEILEVSGKTGQGVDRLLEKIVEIISPPNGRLDKPLRALIFDSKYDTYKGVLAYVRIIDGAVKAEDKLFMMAARAESSVIEVGYFKPQLEKSESLKTGEIGYIATGLRSIDDCRVGDTITANNKQLALENKTEALEGYKEVFIHWTVMIIISCVTRFPSLSLMMPLSLMNQKVIWRLEKDFVADSWDFCIWKLFNQDWNENLKLIQLSLLQALFMK